MVSNAVPDSVTYPSPNEWPQDLVRTITSISKDHLAQITSADHGFTSLNEGQTFMTIKQVKGMLQINGISCVLVQVIDSDNFTVSINSTNFSPYISDGVFIIDTGLPPTQTEGFQTFNRPFQNVA